VRQGYGLPRGSGDEGSRPVHAESERQGNRYNFGDNPTAERRLRLLARVFAPTSETLLALVDKGITGQVLDLGCGPGLTTRMLARRFPEAAVLGLESSAAFVASARAGAGKGVTFLEHDVTGTPLPRAPAAVIYARFLLAHLPGPAALVEAWMGELAPRGVLVLEEVESIRTTDSVFAEYLELMAGVLRTRHAELYIGPVIGQLEVPEGYALAHNDVARLSPTSAQAAALFSLNLVTLRHDAAVVARLSEAELDSLCQVLEDRSHDERVGSITWGMRQVIVRRGAG
jgi:trans-aconitate 2-methyltransferase